MRVDRPRLVLSAVVTAALGVGVAEVFLHYYPRGRDVGPTAASLGDAFTWMLGACLGLFVGSTATAFLVRHGSRLSAGVAAGIAGFWVGVAPYILLTAPSDVSFSDALAFAVIIFVPALGFVAAGAAIGVGLRRLASGV
jgi:hypothetical protein